MRSLTLTDCGLGGAGGVVAEPVLLQVDGPTGADPPAVVAAVGAAAVGAGGQDVPARGEAD